MLHVVYVKVLILTKQKQGKLATHPPRTHLECIDLTPTPFPL